MGYHGIFEPQFPRGQIEVWKEGLSRFSISFFYERTSCFSIAGCHKYINIGMYNHVLQIAHPSEGGSDPQDHLKNSKTPSYEASEQAIRRMCAKNKRTGKRKVGEDIAERFFAGGASRKSLVQLYIKAGGNHDPWSQRFLLP